MFGRNPHLPEDVLFSIPGAVEDPSQYAEILKRRMQQARERVLQYMELQQQRQKENYDDGVRGYAVIDFVFLHNPAIKRGHCKKFHKPWQGSFKVVEVLGPSLYRIADGDNPRKQKVVHFNRLKPDPAPAPAKATPSPRRSYWYQDNWQNLKRVFLLDQESRMVWRVILLFKTLRI